MFVAPQPFPEAWQKLAARVPVGSGMSAAEWVQSVPVQAREAAFWSARVESARVVTSFKDMTEDFLQRAIEPVTTPDGRQETALKVGSEADFVEQARAMLGREGVEFDPADNRITNIGGSARLRLIFRTQVATANGWGRYKAGQSPAILRAFPAARFVRNPGAMVPRPRHVAGEGEVRLKDDLAFWADWHNAADIGGFETPWPPFGYNSFMDQEDVSRRQARALGLNPPEIPNPIDAGDLPQTRSILTETIDEDVLPPLLAELDTAPVSLRPVTKGKPTAPAQPVTRTQPAAVPPGEELAMVLPSPADRAAEVAEITEELADLTWPVGLDEPPTEWQRRENEALMAIIVGLGNFAAYEKRRREQRKPTARAKRMGEALRITPESAQRLIDRTATIEQRGTSVVLRDEQLRVLRVLPREVWK